MAHSLWRTWFLPLLCVWFLTFALLSLAYQTRLPITLRIGGDDWLHASGYLRGFTVPATQEQPRFRYTDGSGRVNLPALGQTAPIELLLHMNAWQPEGARAVTLTLNDQLLRRVMNGEWKTHRILITETARLDPNAFVLGIQSETFVPHEYDANNPNTRKLGAAIEWVTLTPRLASNAAWWEHWTMPAWEILAAVGLMATFAYSISAALSARRFGWLLGLSAILFFALVIAFARLATVAYLFPVSGVILSALWLLYFSRMPQAHARWIFWLLMLSVICLAWAARWVMAANLPLSGDEQIYVPVSARYAEFIAQGRVSEILTWRENSEHPLFVKLSFAVAMLFGHPMGMASELLSARFVSLGATALLTALLALVNPIAAVALAIHSIQIQYSSQAYLEAVPALTITLAMFAFERAQKNGARWLMLSALCLGLTAASKYIYAVAGLALLPFLLWRYRRAPRQIALYGIIALAVFIAADPILWTNPVGNFLETLSFHRRVSASELVSEYARPWYWHLVYLTRLAEWDPGFPFFSLDTLIFFGGLLGLPALFRHSRVYFAWFVVALVFLFLWQTKWEQYALTLITPLCLAFGFGVTDAVRGLVTYHPSFLLRWRATQPTLDS